MHEITGHHSYSYFGWWRLWGVDAAVFCLCFLLYSHNLLTYYLKELQANIEFQEMDLLYHNKQIMLIYSVPQVWNHRTKENWLCNFNILFYSQCVECVHYQGRHSHTDEVSSQ